MFQKYVKIESEFRVLVLGKKAKVWEKKVITKKGEFRHNVALGAREEFLPLAKIPQQIEGLATKAAGLLNLQIAGVDIATEKKTGNIFLVEVNRGPGITYDTNISPEIDKIAEYLASETNGNDES